MAAGIPDVFPTAKRLASIKAAPAKPSARRISVRVAADNLELLYREALEQSLQRECTGRVSLDALMSGIIDEWCSKRRARR